MSPKPRRQASHDDPDDRHPTPAEVPAPSPAGPGRPGWQPFARFPLHRLGPEWFGPNWLTSTDWFGHWDELFPTAWPVPASPGTAPRTFRIEEYEDGDDHVIRAEMPGLDPERDISIEVDGDLLSISATRHEESESRGEVYRSEFSYGTFRRRLRLPPGSTAEDVTATYEAGVLEIRVAVAKSSDATVTIPIQAR